MAKIHNNRAFTIVEILVVVSIIAMLAGFLIVALSGSQDAAKAAKANVKLKEIGMPGGIFYTSVCNFKILT